MHDVRVVGGGQFDSLHLLNLKRKLTVGALALTADDPVQHDVVSEPDGHAGGADRFSVIDSELAVVQQNDVAGVEGSDVFRGQLDATAFDRAFGHDALESGHPDLDVLPDSLSEPGVGGNALGDQPSHQRRWHQGPSVADIEVEVHLPGGDEPVVVVTDDIGDGL